MNTSTLKELIDSIETLSQVDKEFITRVYENGLDNYLKRLEQIKFSNLNSILDAGCGFGQWSKAMTRNNEKIVSVDKDKNGPIILSKLDQTNQINSLVGSIESLPFQNNYFDGIFSYSVIYFTDYKKAIKEFYRVLKKGGMLYINQNDLGWYLYLILSNHNKTSDYNPRKYAIKSILNTFMSKKNGFSLDNGSQYISKSYLAKYLEDIGLKVIDIKGDGCISLNPNLSQTPFFKGKYMGITSTYEVLATKV